jgi:tRNA(Arg) A34 adenosine deaminase TadA
MMIAPPTAQFDQEMYHAALAYYNLPPDYKRVFTRLFKWPIEEKVVCDARAASEDGRVAWVQVNLPHDSYPLRPAASRDIAVYQNLVLDFERPEDPPRALDLAITLAERLVELGLAVPHPDWPLNGRPSVPIECTGAGVHICLALPPMSIAEHGGPDIFDRAVARVVEGYIRAEILGLLGEDIDPLINVHAYDIGHIYSCPGTWRPANLKDRDCPELRPGFLRYWYRHSGDSYPVPYPRRRESAVLAELIATECLTLTRADATYLIWSGKSHRQQARTTPPGDEKDEMTMATPDRPENPGKRLSSPYTVVDTSVQPELPEQALLERDAAFLARALAQATSASARGETPEGAVVVSPEGEVIAEEHSRLSLDCDTSAHAEVVALRAAGARQGTPHLSGSTLYTTHEPCLVCTLLANRAGITRIVYRASRPAALPYQPGQFLGLTCRDVAGWINLQVGWTPLEVVAGDSAEL